MDMPNKVFTGLKTTPADQITKKQSILAALKQGCSFSISDGLKIAGEDESNDTVKMYPPIILINGAGGCGKDTFISEVGKHICSWRISSIDPVVEACNLLVSYEKAYKKSHAERHMDEKDDWYRSFLHDVKAAWVKYSDGPLNTTMQSIVTRITNIINGGNLYDVIFVIIREPEELEKARAVIANDLGLLCLTMLIRGRTDLQEYTNYADQSVYDFDYDIVIINRDNQPEIFCTQAAAFARVLKQANLVYGIPMVFNVNATTAPIIQTDTTYPGESTVSVVAGSGIAFTEATDGTKPMEDFE